MKSHEWQKTEVSINGPRGSYLATEYECARCKVVMIAALGHHLESALAIYGTKIEEDCDVTFCRLTLEE